MSRMLQALRRLEATQKLVPPPTAEDAESPDQAEAPEQAVELEVEQDATSAPFQLPEPVLPRLYVQCEGRLSGNRRW